VPRPSAQPPEPRPEPPAGSERLPVEPEREQSDLGAVVGWVLTSVAGLVMLAGLGFWSWRLRAADSEARAAHEAENARLANYPTAEGELDVAFYSTTQEPGGRVGTQITTIYTVRYRYTVGGREYVGDRLFSTGGNSTSEQNGGSNRERLLQSLRVEFTDVNALKREVAESIVTGGQAGKRPERPPQRVRVHYAPDNPSESYLVFEPRELPDGSSAAYPLLIFLGGLWLPLPLFHCGLLQLSYHRPYPARWRFGASSAVAILWLAFAAFLYSR
jgi:hypothetical protein